MAQEWYYSKVGQRLGPVNAEQLKELATSGQLHPADLVWRDGMADWAPAQKVKGLFREALPAAPPPPTIPQPPVSQATAVGPPPPLPQASPVANPLTRKFLGAPRWAWGSIGVSVLVLGGVRGCFETSKSHRDSETPAPVPDSKAPLTTNLLKSESLPVLRQPFLSLRSDLLYGDIPTIDVLADDRFLLLNDCELWRLPEGEPVNLEGTNSTRTGRQEKEQPLTRLAVSPNGQMLARVGSEIQIYSLTDGRFTLKTTITTKHPPDRVIWSPNLAFIVALYDERSFSIIRLDSVSEGEPIFSPCRHGTGPEEIYPWFTASGPSNVHVSPDGKTLAIHYCPDQRRRSEDSHAHLSVFDTSTSQLIATLPFSEDSHWWERYSPGFSPDGSLLVTVETNSRKPPSAFITMWDTGTWHKLCTLPPSENTFLGFSEARRVATSSSLCGEQATIWDIEGKPVSRLVPAPPREGVRRWVTSSDYQFGLYDTQKHLVEVWNHLQNQLLAVIDTPDATGHLFRALSNSGRYVVSIGGSRCDLRLELWDTHKGVPVAVDKYMLKRRALMEGTSTWIPESSYMERALSLSHDAGLKGASFSACAAGSRRDALQAILVLGATLQSESSEGKRRAYLDERLGQLPHWFAASTSTKYAVVDFEIVVSPKDWEAVFGPLLIRKRTEWTGTSYWETPSLSEYSWWEVLCTDGLLTFTGKTLMPTTPPRLHLGRAVTGAQLPEN